MHWKNRPDGYGLVSVFAHWLVALITIGLFALGYWMVELNYYHAWYNRAPHLHVSVGVLLTLFIFLWLAWMRISARPGAVDASSRWTNFLSRVVHSVLLLLILLLGVSGYLIPTAEGQALKVFDWFSLPALPAINAQQASVAGEIHRVLAYVLIGLVSLHVSAALKHHFYNRDATLKRMLGRR